MKDRYHSLAVALAAVALLNACTPVEEATAPARAADAPLDSYYADAAQPRIAGFWLAQGTPFSRSWLVDGQPLVRDDGGAFVGIPYTEPWGAVYAKRRESNLAGQVYGEPHFDCWPRGMVHAYIGGNANMTLTQTPGRVQQIYEEQNQLRDVFLDGREHPSWARLGSDDYLPTAFGHSVGRWEGDTLVVDTIGVRREFTLGFLAPHSEALHVTERIRRTAAGGLQVDITVDDAQALTKPMSITVHYAAAPPTERFIEDFCTDNLRNMTDVNGIVQTDLRPRKEFGWDLP